MPKTTGKPLPAAESVQRVLALEGTSSALAPFLYFENASIFSHFHGVIRITLEAAALLPGIDNSVAAERVIVAHLRMNVPAAQSLKTALEAALLMAKPPASESPN